MSVTSIPNFFNSYNGVETSINSYVSLEFVLNRLRLLTLELMIRRVVKHLFRKLYYPSQISTDEVRTVGKL